MSVLKILLWIIGIPLALMAAYIGYVFFNMVFIAKITDIKKSFDSEYEAKLDGIEIVEISDNESVMETEFNPGTGDIDGSKVMVFTTEGILEDRRRWFDDDPGREVEVVVRDQELKSLVFKENGIYEIGSKNLAKKIGSYSNPELSLVRQPVNKNIMLVNGDRVEAQYADPWLWQLDLNTFEKFLLTKDPYYSHSRPPKIFINKNTGEKIVIYYTGDYSFGFGGHSSRPKNSVVRIYNKQFPEGNDLASFAFKAGTIVNVDWYDNDIILTGDPSKPTGSKKDRMPARKWKLLSQRVLNKSQ